MHMVSRRTFLSFLFGSPSFFAPLVLLVGHEARGVPHLWQKFASITKARPQTHASACGTLADSGAGSFFIANNNCTKMRKSMQKVTVNVIASAVHIHGKQIHLVVISSAKQWQYHRCNTTVHAVAIGRLRLYSASSVQT